jgi:hypothetical protein
MSRAVRRTGHPQAGKHDERRPFAERQVRQVAFGLTFLHFTSHWTIPSRSDRFETAGKYEGQRHRLTICSTFASVSGRNHSETCVGCIVALTTLTRSSLKASRSVSWFSMAEKASNVFLASYLLR